MKYFLIVSIACLGLVSCERKSNQEQLCDNIAYRANYNELQTQELKFFEDNCLDKNKL